MADSILITGASRGIGRTTAERFAEAGWNVVATMRDPADGTELATRANVMVTHLDVTDEQSARDAVAGGIDAFGAIDVVFNNAGYGVFGALETIEPESMQQQFEVNVFGMLRVTRAILPHFRARGEGLVIQMSSIAGRAPFPLGSVYNASKFAVEGLSEALYFELAAIGARIKLIEPGVIATDALGSSLVVHRDDELAGYRDIHAALMAAFEASGAMAAQPALVAGVVFEAATDPGPRLRYPVGPDAEMILARRRESDDESFLAWLRSVYGV